MNANRLGGAFPRQSQSLRGSGLGVGNQRIRKLTRTQRAIGLIAPVREAFGPGGKSHFAPPVKHPRPCQPEDRRRRVPPQYAAGDGAGHRFIVDRDIIEGAVRLHVNNLTTQPPHHKLQPFDLLAQTQGYHALGTGQQVLKDWVFTTLAVNNGWATTHRAVIIAILRALREAIQYGATHKADAIATLIQYTHAAPDIAEKTYDLDFVQWKAFRPDLAVTPAQLATIAKYQIQFGVITAAPSFADMYDGSYVTAALAR